MKQYIVDAFTDEVFSGNPAAVCVMDSWLSEELMMKIAGENNLSETAFAVKEGTNYRLRWFTPGGEIDLCGHATLATAFVLMNYYDNSLRAVAFSTMSGDLTVQRREDAYEMDFPAYELRPVPVTEAIIEAAGAVPAEAYMGRDLLCMFDSEETVRNLRPDLEKLKTIDGLLFHATAAGAPANGASAAGGVFDCVSRSFAPKLNVPEDPVCGSGHCHIAPYWAGKLGKNEIVAYQASRRGGTLYCRLDGKRVKLAGKAALFAAAEIFV